MQTRKQPKQNSDGRTKNRVTLGKKGAVIALSGFRFKTVSYFASGFTPSPPTNKNLHRLRVTKERSTGANNSSFYNAFKGSFRVFIHPIIIGLD